MQWASATAPSAAPMQWRPLAAVPAAGVTCVRSVTGRVVAAAAVVGSPSPAASPPRSSPLYRIRREVRHVATTVDLVNTKFYDIFMFSLIYR